MIGAPRVRLRCVYTVNDPREHSRYISPAELRLLCFPTTRKLRLKPESILHIMADTSTATRHDSFHNNGRLSAGIVQQGTGHAGRDLYNGKPSLSYYTASPIRTRLNADYHAQPPSPSSTTAGQRPHRLLLCPSGAIATLSTATALTTSAGSAPTPQVVQHSSA